MSSHLSVLLQTTTTHIPVSHVTTTTTDISRYNWHTGFTFRQRGAEYVQSFSSAESMEVQCWVVTVTRRQSNIEHIKQWSATLPESLHSWTSTNVLWIRNCRAEDLCAITRWQQFSAWNNIMATILKAQHQLGNVTPFTWRTILQNFALIRFEMMEP